MQRRQLDWACEKHVLRHRLRHYHLRCHCRCPRRQHLRISHLNHPLRQLQTSLYRRHDLPALAAYKRRHENTHVKLLRVQLRAPVATTGFNKMAPELEVLGWYKLREAFFPKLAN